MAAADTKLVCDFPDYDRRGDISRHLRRLWMSGILSYGRRGTARQGSGGSAGALNAPWLGGDLHLYSYTSMDFFLFYWLVDAIKRGTDKYSHTSVRAHAHTHAYLFTQHTQYQNKTNNKLGITTRLAGSSHKKERLI